MGSIASRKQRAFGVSWQEQSIFVTGATGFIGGRVCERLVQAGASRVRALVHSPHRAARIARLPIELCPGNLLDPGSLREALAGASLVIHCGLGDARAIVQGTENLLRICVQSGVKRFVHMSTTAVYGLTPPPGCETEEAPVRLTGDQYCDNKARAEQVVLKFGKRGLSAVILRPSIVCGPFSAWSTRLIENLRDNRVVLIDDGRGSCNTTYVDNLVDAIFLSLENEQAIGHTFFITDGEAITWGDFIRAHIAMLQNKPQLREALRTGVIFGAVEALTPVVGWTLGLAAARYVSAWDHWIAFVLLCALGLHMIYAGLQPEKEDAEPKPDRHSYGSG